MKEREEKKKKKKKQNELSLAVYEYAGGTIRLAE